MLGLFSASSGSAVLRLRCCDRPLNVDQTGVTHRRVDWRSIRITKTSRRYLDGRVSGIQIYDGAGVNGISVHPFEMAKTLSASYSPCSRGPMNCGAAERICI